MAWSSGGLRFLLVSLIVAHLICSVHCQEDTDENLDLDEERHMHEHELDFHDIDDYEMNDQGYNVDEEYDIQQEVRHTDRDHVDDMKVLDTHNDVDKVETIDYLGILNPELMKNMNFRVPDFDEKRNEDLERLKSEIKRLDKVDESYRQLVSSLLATTAELRVQIMQLNTTIKRLDERDRLKDDKLRDLETIIANKSGCESTTCNSEKDGDSKKEGKRPDEL